MITRSMLAETLKGWAPSRVTKRSFAFRYLHACAHRAVWFSMKRSSLQSSRGVNKGPERPDPSPVPRATGARQVGTRPWKRLRREVQKRPALREVSASSWRLQYSHAIGGLKRLSRRRLSALNVSSATSNRLFKNKRYAQS